MSGVIAVVVAYHPNPAQLQENLHSLLPQVDQLVVVDNTPGGCGLRETFQPRLSWIELGANCGIGVAQNVGVRWAIGQGATYVLLSDQDSVYPPGTVVTLQSSCEALQAQGKRVGAVGPAFVNPHIEGGAEAVFVWQPGATATKRRAMSGLVEASYVIASGCLIPTEVWTQVGEMDESLFIDWVDTEWCLRARRSGFGIWGCADVRIQHRIGDYSKPFMGRRIALHSPVRHYYMVRNGLLLSLRRSPLNALQRLWALGRVLAFVGVFPLLATPHLRHGLACLQGLRDGLLGRRGGLQ